MNVSLRSVGTFMDPVDELVALRHVASHHRWPGEMVNMSLAQIGRRHTHSSSVRLRFLWYNTFLMRVRLTIARAIADVATPREVMEAFGVSPKQILAKFDVCNLLPNLAARLACKAAGDAVGYVIDFFGGAWAVVDAIIDAVGAEKVIEWVLVIAGVPEELTLAEKPALKARAREIGEVLRIDGYDLVALCETWNADTREELLNHWQLPVATSHLARGRPEGDAFLGDGLLVGSRSGEVVDVKRRAFDTRGIDRFPGRLLDMVADDELWAQKGILLVRIDTGVGEVDLYVTHLYFGTGLAGSDVAKFFPHVTPPTNSEREAVRTRQLEQLGQFITETHRPENVAMVCGDFNIDASGKHPDYAGLAALQQLMNQHNLEDRWIEPHGKLEGATGGKFDKICGALQTGDPRYCDDTASSSDTTDGYRIDLILVEKVKPQHSFMLDVTRIRRRPFPRAQVTENQAYMSDHLGLDCTLLASPLGG